MRINSIFKTENRFNCEEFNDFLLEEAYLEDVSVTSNSIKFRYLLDGEAVDCSFRYDSIHLDDLRLGSAANVQCLAVY